MDKVNIIMATYQGEKFLKEQLDSILKSSFQNFNIIIYDDGSIDRTIEIAQSYQEQYPDKIIFHRNEKNLGHLKNFLHGISSQNCEYIMFCDQDDVWKSDKIEKTYQCMKRVEAKCKQPIPIAVFTDAVIVDEALHPLFDSFHQVGRLDTSKLDLSHMLMENKMMGCTMMINRPLMDKMNQLPEQARFHDWWIGLIAASFGKIVYLAEPTMLYRQHGTNVVGNLSFRDYVVNRMNGLKEQKKALNKTYLQAQEFYDIYHESLSKEDKIKLKAFINLPHMGFIKKRRIAIQYGFMKSGFTRNIGLLLLL